MAVMTVSEARAALPEVLNRVADGEEITITRHGLRLRRLSARTSCGAARGPLTC